MPLPQFDDSNSELIRVLRKRVKKSYEDGKRTGDSNFQMTAEDLAAQYKKMFGKIPSENLMQIFQDIADYLTYAWRIGAKDAKA